MKKNNVIAVAALLITTQLCHARRKPRSEIQKKRSQNVQTQTPNQLIAPGQSVRPAHNSKSTSLAKASSILDHIRQEQKIESVFAREFRTLIAQADGPEKDQLLQEFNILTKTLPTEPEPQRATARLVRPAIQQSAPQDDQETLIAKASGILAQIRQEQNLDPAFLRELNRLVKQISGSEKDRLMNELNTLQNTRS